MFESNLYIDEEKIDTYLCELVNLKKSKKWNISFSINLPFVSISANGEFSKDLSSLSAKQKLILFESLISQDETLLWDYTEKPDEIDLTTLPINTFIKFSAGMDIPEIVGQINGVSGLLSGQFGELAKKEILSSDPGEQSITLINALTNNNSNLPVISKIDDVIMYAELDEINIDGISNIDFFDEIAESVTVIAKIVKNQCNETKVKVYDLGKNYFGLSRPIRKQIKNYDNDENLNYFVNGPAIKIEVLAIKY